MPNFDEWSNESAAEVNGHNLRLVTLKDGYSSVAQEKAAAVLPDHYTDPRNVAKVLEMSGKIAAAKYFRTKVPTKQNLRSGDLGEIFATEYIAERTKFCVPVKKLRWRDHREMPMRGEDVIGLCHSEENRLIKFLKAEAKSRAALKAPVVKKARDALNDKGGLPSEHALSFIAERLRELRKDDLADAVIAQLLRGIDVTQVTHLLFTLSGNKPDDFLRADLNSCGDSIPQNGVGLRITNHQEFIRKIFDRALGE